MPKLPYKNFAMITNKIKPATIDDYIKEFPMEVQDILQKIRVTIRNSAPDAEEAMSYQIPTFKLNGNLVHFAAYKRHIGFYPTSSGIENFKDEISGYKSSRGTVQFPLDKPIPYDMIKKIVEFRVKENLNKSKNWEKKD